MYKVENEQICAMLDSESRCFRTIMDFGDFAISGDHVGQITIDGGSVQNELPCIGDVVSAQAEIIVIKIPDGVTLEGREFRLYLYCISPTGTVQTTHAQLADFTHEQLSKLTHARIAELGNVPLVPIPIGKFTVLKCRKEEDYYRLTCTDRLHFADAPYSSKLKYPTTSDKVVAEICQRLGADTDLTEAAAGRLKESGGAYLRSSDGFRFMLATWQFDVAQKPVGKTMRQMLSYIAAMRGKFVVIDRVGTIVQRWYLADGARTLDFKVDGNKGGTNCRISDYTLGETTIDVGRLVCKVSDGLTLRAGNENARSMEFECPYMTRERLNRVVQEVGISKYRPCEMTQQLGDPRLDPWDGFEYEGEALLMLNTVTTCDGGLMIDISSEGDTDTELDAIGTY